ncbi:hypothetical protein PspLS_07121 [Pyricularia sp. CBS 133598]|nr:hypothetical protein PspLS_07121 [Pyricularia sp. CBS 133598]
MIFTHAFAIASFLAVPAVAGGRQKAPETPVWKASELGGPVHACFVAMKKMDSVFRNHARMRLIAPSLYADPPVIDLDQAVGGHTKVKINKDCTLESIEGHPKGYIFWVQPIHWDDSPSENDLIERTNALNDLIPGQL